MVCNTENLPVPIYSPKGGKMSTLELTIAITAVANAIASEIPNDGELAVLSAVIGQLSSTLATIAASRSSNSSTPGDAYIHSL